MAHPAPDEAQQSRRSPVKTLLCLIMLLPATVWAAHNQILLYDGYGSRERMLIDGRVIASEQKSPAKADDAWYHNLWRTLRTLKNDERENHKMTLKIGGNEARAISDEEGYFRASIVPLIPLATGWHSVSATGTNAQGEGRLLIVSTRNTLGVISDIDDTVLISDVTNKSQLLKNTFLKNAQQRQTFPSTAGFYQRLLAQNPEPKSAPMFYVSASPRQLAQNISAFLTQNHFPQGVLMTKQISGNGRDPLRDQKQYKTTKIENIFNALPWVRFVLIGDDGEQDPETFQALKENYPERVAAIYIRKVHPDPQRRTYLGQQDLGDATKP